MGPSTTDRPAAPETAEGQDWPWYRSPFTWAFVIGIVVLTLLRPCMRHIPEAPAVLGPGPAVAYQLWDGDTEQTLLVGDGTVRVVQLLPEGPCAACDEATAGLASQLNRLQRSEGPFSLVTIVVPSHLLPASGDDAAGVAGDDAAGSRAALAVSHEAALSTGARGLAEQLWRTHGIESSGLWSFGVASTLPSWPVESLSVGLHGRGEAAAEWTEFLQLGRVWIMDGTGSVRGVYAPGTGDGALEIFHRIFHVLRESGASFRQAS